MDVELNSNAAKAFTLFGDKLTLKASGVEGAITLDDDKDLTLQNGAAISGGVIDKNGDSFLSFEGVDTWDVYASSADANIEVSALGSGNVSTSFRFTFSSEITYYLRVVASGETLFKTVMPVKSGKTIITLNTAGQLAALAGALNSIQEKMAKETTVKSGSCQLIKALNALLSWVCVPVMPSRKGRQS